MIGQYLQRQHQGLAPDASMANGGGGGSSQPANTTSTTTREIPAWAQPYAQDLLNRGSTLSNTPYQTYDGQRIADMNWQQQAGLNQVQQNALNGGSAEQLAARENFIDTMNGDYLGKGVGVNNSRVQAGYNQYADMNNPYLKGMVNQSLNDVQGRVNSQFGGNNYGTTAHQETLQRGLSEAANNAYGNAYNLNAQLQNQNADRFQQASAANANIADQNASRYQQAYAAERGNQLKMSALGDMYGNMANNNAQQLIGVGDIYRNEQQDVLNNQFADWTAAQNQPYRQLDALANSLGAAVNGQGSVSSAGYAYSPYSSNNYASAIGTGLAGYGLLSGLGGNNSNSGLINSWFGNGSSQ